MSDRRPTDRLPTDWVPGTEGRPIERQAGDGVEQDWLAIEAPLEIRLDGEPLAVTLRTPGHDRELAAGFLFTEGIIRLATDLLAVAPSDDPMAYDPDNLIEVRLASAAAARHAEIEQARRRLMTTAACGLCGKARLEDVYQRLPQVEPMAMDRSLIQRLPGRLEAAQSLFQRTGGVHAAGLFDDTGTLLSSFEDIGRHNAIDKLIGADLLDNRGPWHRRIVVTSGRAGFEIVQKVIMAGAATLVAVGAASTLAVDTASRCGLDLFSFVRDDRSIRHRPAQVPGTD